VSTKTYFRPQSLEEALCLRDQYGAELLVLAGGTMAVPLINKGVSRPELAMGLRAAGLNYVRQAEGEVRIGAAATITQVRQEAGIPLLEQAARNVAAWAIQNMGTAGGNLFAPPPAGDLAVALLALDAVLEIASHSRGSRQVPLAEFYTGFMTNCLEVDELVVEIRVPKPEGETVLLKHGRLYTNTPAIVTAAVHCTFEGDAVQQARIALNAVGPHPIRASQAEAAITGRPLDETAISAAGKAAAEECEPFTDPIATEWYRRKMAGVFVQRALAQIAAERN
jgi:CO/xanthine dehydrogenase FAD-binding subunit